jgi:aromatic ring-opening dioxygenase catalytic subunit (LigB family)
MSAMSFLYLLTGCLDLALKEGQKKQRLPQAGRTWRETTPDTVVILEFQKY